MPVESKQYAHQEITQKPRYRSPYLVHQPQQQQLTPMFEQIWGHMLDLENPLKMIQDGMQQNQFAIANQNGEEQHQQVAIHNLGMQIENLKHKFSQVSNINHVHIADVQNQQEKIAAELKLLKVQVEDLEAQRDAYAATMDSHRFQTIYQRLHGQDHTSDNNSGDNHFGPVHDDPHLVEHDANINQCTTQVPDLQDEKRIRPELYWNSLRENKANVVSKLQHDGSRVSPYLVNRNIKV